MVAGLVASLAKGFIGCEARWEGCAPSATQRIYIANHTSHADFVLLWAALPSHLRRRTFPVAAADYWDRGAVRRYLAREVFGAVLIERVPAARDGNPIAPMLAALHRGESLILFPEGTRGRGSDLLPFKCGIYHLACECPTVELVPVWIDNPYRVLPKGSVLPAPLLCTAMFGKPTRLLPDEPKQEFLARLRNAVLRLAPAKSDPFAFQTKSFQQVSPLPLRARTPLPVAAVRPAPESRNGRQLDPRTPCAAHGRALQPTFSRNPIPPLLRRGSSREPCIASRS